MRVYVRVSMYENKTGNCTGNTECNTGNGRGNVLYTETLEMQHIYVNPLPARVERVALEIQHRATTSPAT